MNPKVFLFSLLLLLAVTLTAQEGKKIDAYY